MTRGSSGQRADSRETSTPGAHALSQGLLPMEHVSAEATADRYQAAARIFTSFMQVADRMGVDATYARKVAAGRAERATGIDWRAELGPPPARRHARSRAPTPRAPGPALQFLEAWRNGSLGLPWVPVLSSELHAAFVAWTVREGLPEASMKALVVTLAASGQLRQLRTSWRVCKAMQGPSALLVPVDSRREGSECQADWLGRGITAFRTAGKRRGLL